MAGEWVEERGVVSEGTFVSLVKSFGNEILSA